MGALAPTRWLTCNPRVAQEGEKCNRRVASTGNLAHCSDEYVLMALPVACEASTK